MTTDRPNMFEKAAEERRAKIIEENNYVADEILSTRIIPIEEDVKEDNSIPNNSLKKLLAAKDKPIKRQCSYYLDANIDDFFMRLGEIMEVSKSEIVNQLLRSAIIENPEIQEMAQINKRVNRILREFHE